jgi:hypothetical protein
LSSPERTPPPTEATSPWAASTAKITHTGSPGTAWHAVAAANSRLRPVTAARGPIRSAADNKVAAPTSWARDGPNMASAVSSGDPVAEWTRVPRASPETVPAATDRPLEAKSGVNSGARKSSR